MTWETRTWRLGPPFLSLCFHISCAMPCMCLVHTSTSQILRNVQRQRTVTYYYQLSGPVPNARDDSHYKLGIALMPCIKKKKLMSGYLGSSVS